PGLADGRAARSPGGLSGGVVLGGLGLVALGAWLYLGLGHGGFWRSGPGPPAGDDAAGPADWPGVVAVVPARDEADVLPGTLPTLLAQDYPGDFRVIVVDDGSTDGTAAAAARPGDGR